MNIFTGELLGTFLLIILGNGVVANVVLNKTKGNNSGWIVIAFGWAIAVFVGVFVAAPLSGAHLNPAITLSLAVLNKISWSEVHLREMTFQQQPRGAQHVHVIVHDQNFSLLGIHAGKKLMPLISDTFLNGCLHQASCKTYSGRVPEAG